MHYVCGRIINEILLWKQKKIYICQILLLLLQIWWNRKIIINLIFFFLKRIWLICECDYGACFRNYKPNFWRIYEKTIVVNGYKLYVNFIRSFDSYYGIYFMLVFIY